MILADVQQLPVVLTIEETAQLLRIGRRQGYEAAQRGDFPTLQFGRRRVVPTALLLAMLGLEHDEGAPEGASVDQLDPKDEGDARPGAPIDQLVPAATAEDRYGGS
jgi:hypothetical protein